MIRYFICLFLILTVQKALSASDTTRVLFIGNSFTYYNTMPDLFKAMADAGNKPCTVTMYAPGGVSVGDISQGTMAHSANPAVYSLIRSKKWDYLVLQDNQGRFVLDSATFPSSSLVKAGHIKIMDSLHYYNSCAKMILFAGWGVQNGQPPYGNTGIEMIKRILVNYRVLNDSMHEIISPIGEAWIKAISQMPATNLWDADQTHPSLAGSYLTAAVIYASVFNTAVASNSFQSTLSGSIALPLKQFADSVVFNSFNHARYNLVANQYPVITYVGGNLTVPGNYTAVNWYLNGSYITTAQSIPAALLGVYTALVKDATGCKIKTCAFTLAPTGLREEENNPEIFVYPNPVKENLQVSLNTPGQTPSAQQVSYEIYNAWGETLLNGELMNATSEIHLQNLVPGLYVIKLKQASNSYSYRFLKD